MPHLTVEYSANLAAVADIGGLLDAVHDAALATGVFPPGGTRTRGERRDEYRIADRHPENMFVHVTARIGHGRDAETRKRAGEALMAAVTGFLDPVFARHPLAISLEIQEIDPILNFKKNNNHEYVASRAGRAAAE
jgi:5-carboxymethyl-2-hydroxymuconate isomerase